ncbi:MAG: hypothetical protein A2X67_10675 [Ignavibacteria bacterium GWA2_55_11]|nr:MAG: hypothetical protein A2X67_10675 [Ignavibacteria bacterium GWA2_55_11]OGU44007.1 MAG: hypothetical protein A2X68_02395 [Ignavibacteria bacterium GWC2_56_12]OGU65162.1 MAG: hypothetical protein A3C56_01040 [Ignavibacteria bacterium RIFCSPHIGHO2_02_FULL_56_12]OGU71742.1 MAG: hypothetical protein A3H45_04480 [Ignavibacteria bacterium RIFCSPLOWO2_02_FULL_55_14]OGU73690.1 MAG: hypothetical protein A3G43_01560 [Ignavibacteria bacterium RIFCSPLOWO2_12_FULL_56_21]
MTEPKSILVEILREAKAKDFFITTTQLVKLLYLVEVEYYRDFSARLTDLRWLFYHYGPYALELGSVLDDKEFQQIERVNDEGRKYTQFTVEESKSKFGLRLDPKLTLVVKRVVGTWGNVRLPELLDYVYFDTEPMQAVERRGQVLDFTAVKKEINSKIIPLKASKETDSKVAALRRQFAPTLKKLSEHPRPQLELGKEYNEAMAAWDEDMKTDLDLESLKKIFVTISKETYGSGEEGN